MAAGRISPAAADDGFTDQLRQAAETIRTAVRETAHRKQASLDEKLAVWLKRLSDDDYEVRQKAMQEMLEAYTDALGEKLKPLLVQAQDPEVRARLEAALRWGPGYKPARELEAKLSKKTLEAVPGIADLAYSRDPKDMERVLDQVWPAALIARPKPDPLDRKDCALIFGVLMKNWSAWKPDWRSFPAETKLKMLSGLADLRAEPSCVPNVRLLLEDADSTCRTYALAALIRILPRPDAERLAVRLARHPDARMRERVMQAFIDLEAKAPLPLVLESLGSDPDENVRLACVSYLDMVFYKDTRLVPAILGALDDESAAVAAQATLALENWGLAEEYRERIRRRPIQAPR